MSRPFLTLASPSAESTRQLAAGIAELVRPGDLVLLVGDLGAGKTAFTQGFGAGLGVTEPITSPTFALVRSYSGRLDLYHLDVYRLEQIGEALDLGLSELLDDGAVTVIEWGDTIAPALPPDYLEIRIEFDDGPLERPDARRIELVARGRQWAARTRVLATALDRWAVGDEEADQDGGTAGQEDSDDGGAPC